MGGNCPLVRGAFRGYHVCIQVTTMIRLKNVSKTYPPNVVGIKGVSLHIPAGEFVSIVGKSGTGKSTLAKLLFAEERPTSGIVEIGGWDITHINDRDIPLLRRQIGVVFQDFKLLQKKTVYATSESETKSVSQFVQRSGI